MDISDIVLDVIIHITLFIIMKTMKKYLLPKLQPILVLLFSQSTLEEIGMIAQSIPVTITCVKIITEVLTTTLIKLTLKQLAELGDAMEIYTTQSET